MGSLDTNKHWNSETVSLKLSELGGWVSYTLDMIRDILGRMDRGGLRFQVSCNDLFPGFFQCGISRPRLTTGNRQTSWK